MSTATLQFVGNATMVLRLGAFTLLTDPNFLHRGQLAYLGHGLVSRRLTEPAVRIVELPPLDAIVQGGHRLTVTSMPGQHATGLARRLLPPVMGSLLDLEAGDVRLRLYISGDTLMVDELRDIPRRYGDIDAAVLHLGGTTLPGGLVVTMDAMQVVALPVRTISPDDGGSGQK